MIRLRIRGIRVDICFSFLLFNALIFLIREKQVILCFYGGCILHELGHILAAAAVGIKTESVVLSGSGIIMETEKSAVCPIKKSLIVLLSGPAVNLAFAGITALWGSSSLFTVLNLVLCMYNLLPFPGLDGGSAIEIIIGGSSWEYAARRVVTAVRYLMLLAALAALLHGIKEIFPAFAVLLCLNIINYCSTN